MAATDRFADSTSKGNVTAPARSAVAITPDDNADLTLTTRYLYVGGAGNIKVDMADGTTVTFTAITIGIVHPLRVRRVYSTGTTATLILGLS